MRTIITLAILGLILIACTDQKDSTPMTITHFPLEVGNKWEYTRTLKDLVYSDETMTEITDTIDITEDFTIQVTKDTTLGDTLALKKVVETPYGITTYKTNTVSGLKLYANSRKTKQERHNPTDILTYQLAKLHQPTILKEDINFYQEPLLEYRYPMSIGTKWIYSDIDSPNQIKITKEVIGFENIVTAGRIFTCMKIRFTHEPESFFDGLEMTEWVAQEGRIKEETKVNAILVSATGEEIGYISGT
nr:hypothetical protein [Salinivirgaceae bacterium]